jgi:hypothetical protein
MRGLYLPFVLASLSQAVRVYLNPEPSQLSNALTPEQASVALSHYFGVERFENLGADDDLSDLV